jgi:hypothetical protein
VAGALALAVLPVAVVLSESVRGISLVQAGAATPIAAILGLLALVLGRRAQRRAERTLGRVAGQRTARMGRLLGWIALYLAGIATVALAFYAVLEAGYGA